MLVNCDSDVQLARKFIRNPKTGLLPFAFDECVFYPLAASGRTELRARHGFAEHDRILIYAGRVNASKNVHTLLRIFKAVLHIVPDTHLVIAGSIDSKGWLWQEWGLMPVRFRTTLDRVIATLGLPEDRIQLKGSVTGDQLRELLNIADIKVNMTLNHDENFGLGQVEAMACGTPVIGAAWGGLKDTIVDGKSGSQVSVAVTSTGVKVNWWEAVNKIVALLRDPAKRDALRVTCIERAQCFTRTRFQQRLDEILANSVRNLESPPRPLEATRFAQEYWQTCDPKLSRPIYRRGPKSFELYMELTSTYAGLAPEHVTPDEPLEDEQVLCLATPIDSEGDGQFRVDDPHYLFEVEVPAPHLETFRSVLAVMRLQPAMTVRELTRCVTARAGWQAGLRWMLSAGLLLRSRPVAGWVAPQDVNERLSQVLFTVQALDAAPDFVLSTRL
jgi:hypothetical protein